MYALQRWWERYGIQSVLVGVALGTALFVRQTQGGVLLETYQLLTRPFHGKPTQQDRLINAQTQELQQRLIELESRNQRLEELLGFVSAKKVKGVTAPVIGRSADHWWQQVILGRGSQDGIRVGSIVLSPGGLVGRVSSVTSDASQVLLLSDPSSRVGVTISRSRYMGFMRGKSANRAVMEFFEKVPDVRRGDVVSTSPFSQLFPAGIPIGRIESVDLNKSPAPEAIIELSAPINYLEWATVYPNSANLGDPQLTAPSAPIPASAPSPEATP
ncbi:rod shape-determining protein MreC [Phormidesmis priestleyi ULC007]|uniref:Cell shape-determining protein MreC n=1 Tax=Phormidesmis priestleyi ULC007 TaxID=1920490 RepID=A0A2T1D650_9CYAN|nr:rod shape-determining protein MreC [Phormidesmis priestleyi]PSB15993.1 rod shape-determining protein MreC [Phormidesmis priestleyi ULC007]PZO46623.1 MAG: rod shape-determining protein MreC [Phormidesmis priestleyi]